MKIYFYMLIDKLQKLLIDEFIMNPYIPWFTRKFHIGSEKMVRDLSGSTKSWKGLSDDQL